MTRDTIKQGIKFWAPLIVCIGIVGAAFAWWLPWTWQHWKFYDGGDRQRTIEWGEDHP